jgi:maltooligosyltrehalose trehalohydrolase
LADVLNSPFLYAGNYCRHRGRKHGASPAGLGGDRFVVCIQNHDQVGNRARGDRLSTLLDSPAQLRLAAALLLLSPHLPLLFMGEEYGEENPFPFFCSFCGPELIEAVREGRKREFADFLDDAEEIPDPDAAATFASAKLSWSWPQGTARAGLRQLYADLLKARREWPALRDFTNRKARLLPDADQGPVLELVRGDQPGQAAVIWWNLSDDPQRLPREVGGNQAVLFSSEWVRYTGARDEGLRVEELLPFECMVLGSNGGCGNGPRTASQPLTWPCGCMTIPPAE